MKRIFLFLFIFSILILNISVFSLEDEIARATVKIFNRSQYNYSYSPWNYSSVSYGTGSGAVIAKGKIITNAHVVSNSRFLFVKKFNDPYEYRAKVLFIAHDCDLAIIDVTEKKDEFYNDINPLKFGSMPDLRSKVNTIGYPRGGNKISITEGVVSRIEYRTYVHDGDQSHLAIQTDAAINSGNSGGPVLKDGKIVGIAFQSMTSGQNIGYFIPVTVVQRFLKDIKDNNYDGYVSLGIVYQNMKNKTLKEKLNVKNRSGVYVSEIFNGYNAEKVLKRGDVLHSINGVDIADDGTVITEYGRLKLKHVIEDLFDGDKITIEYTRDGNLKKTELTLKKEYQKIVKSNQYEYEYSYYICAGYVFRKLSRDYLESWGNDWYKDASMEQLYYYYNLEILKDTRKDIVVLSRILPLDINKYNRDKINVIVKKVNGKKIRSFEQFVTTVELLIEKGEKYIEISFENRSDNVLIPVNMIKDSIEEVRKKYNIKNIIKIGEKI